MALFKASVDYLHENYFFYLRAGHALHSEHWLQSTYKVMGGIKPFAWPPFRVGEEHRHDFNLSLVSRVKIVFHNQHCNCLCDILQTWLFIKFGGPFFDVVNPNPSIFKMQFQIRLSASLTPFTISIHA